MTFMDLIPLYVVLAIIAIWCGVVTYLYFRLIKSIQRINRGNKKENVIDVLNEVLENEKKLDAALVQISRKVEGLLFDSQFYIQKIGLVRFNPFNDTGGDQSFILALIDDNNSGVVISGLHTRNGTRWYAKQVREGKGAEYELSADEIKAIKSAKKDFKDERS